MKTLKNILRRALGERFFLFLQLKKDEQKKKWQRYNLERRQPEARINISTDLKRPAVHLGSSYGGWYIDSTQLNANSIVYSIGIGYDISFDLALIKRFNCRVYAFDPTPRSIEWIKNQSLPDNLTYHQYGLSNHDGELTLYAPNNKEHISHTQYQQPSHSTESVSVPVRTLQTIAKQFKHTTLDLLKMDIEGSEYDVIPTLNQGSIRVKQLLVEFHHRFPTAGGAKTEEAVHSLRTQGFRLYKISPSGEEFSFLHESALR